MSSLERQPFWQGVRTSGPHVKFGPPEEWILTLGSLIVKIHVKDYKVNPSDPDGHIPGGGREEL